MNVAEALLYGAVQGIAEYLPISSSAHLILLPRFLHQDDPGLTFDVFLHLGTLMATMLYFWREWWAIFVALPRTFGVKHGSASEVEMWKLIALATVPALLVGGLTHKWIETVFRGNIVIICTLPLGGVALFLADYLCPNVRKLSQARFRDAFWIGVAQCFALIPGVSRSGSTMTGARLLGLDRVSAARFSFLISAPVTAAAIVFELRHWDRLFSGSSVGWLSLCVAGFSSFVFGCLAIGGLLKMLRHFGYFSFAVYRIGLALIIFYVLGV